MSCLQAKTPVAPTITNMLKIAEPMIVPTPPFDGMKKVQTIDLPGVGACELFACFYDFLIKADFISLRSFGGLFRNF